MANLIRYSLDRGPFEPVAGLLPILDAESGPGRQFRFHFAADKADLRWRVLASRNMIDWAHVLHDTATDGPPPEAPGWHSAAVTIPASLDPAPSTPDPRLFLRLELLLLPPP